MRIWTINLEQVVVSFKQEGYFLFLLIFFPPFRHGTMRPSPLTRFQIYLYISTSVPIIITFEYLIHIALQGAELRSQAGLNLADGWACESTSEAGYMCQLNALALWTSLSAWCKSLELCPLRSGTVLTVVVWLLMWCSWKALEKILWPGPPCITHTAQCECDLPGKGLQGMSLPGRLRVSRELADVSPLLPEPSVESGKGQQAQLLSGNTQAVAELSTAQHWGKERAEHLVHLLLNVLWCCKK